MSVYKGTIERDGRFWLITVPGVGSTQARHLREADEMAVDLVAVMRDVDPSNVHVELERVLPRPVVQHLERMHKARKTESAARTKAAEELRAAARALSSTGMPLRDVGEILGVSHQRAHQLVH